VTLHRTVRRTAVVALVSMLAAVLPAGVAQAAPSPVAKASWSMVPQAKDTNNDGVIDGDGGVPRSGAMTRNPSTSYKGAGNRIAQPDERLIDGSLSWYLSPKGFPVQLDACASTGESYRWRITSGGTSVKVTPWRSLAKKSCRLTLTLPEDRYSLRLDVRSGGRTAQDTVKARVRNILIVSMGDSYASGEGNPRNVQAWLAEGAPFRPYWDSSSCNRSALAAPAQAALALEEASPRTSVTLIDVSCSSATVNRGILGPQASAGQSESQIEQAARLMAGQTADLVLLSIGGNDVGFTSILQTCALANNCPIARPPAGPLQGSPTVQEGVQAQTADLASDYDRIASCIGSGPCTLADGRTVTGIRLAKGAQVMPTLYPDITRAATGQPCQYLTITPADFGWARDTTLLPTPPNPYAYTTTDQRTVDLRMAAGSLNQQIAATTRLGWAPITGTWAASGESAEGHGVCAGPAAWAFGLTLLSGFTDASFHPNPTGQRVMARQITAAAETALQP